MSLATRRHIAFANLLTATLYEVEFHSRESFASREDHIGLWQTPHVTMVITMLRLVLRGEGDGSELRLYMNVSKKGSHSEQ